MIYFAFEDLLHNILRNHSLWYGTLGAQARLSLDRFFHLMEVYYLFCAELPAVELHDIICNTSNLLNEGNKYVMLCKR